MRDAIHRTPLVESSRLSAAASGRVLLKLETLQVTNSFKARGGLNAATVFAAQGGRTIVTASAGNHGRAIAWAARSLGLHAIVFTPRGAPAVKLRAIEQLGAELRAESGSYEECEQAAQAYANASGLTYISPYDHADVIAGAGTVALEILEEEPAVAVLVIPVGGGGLVSGTAVAAKAINPAIQVIGVEIEASTAFTTARRAGHVVTVEVGATIADGLSGNPDPHTSTWPYIRDLVDATVVVPEAALRSSMCDLILEEHLVAEGAGAVGAAALAAGLVPLEGRTAAVVLSGSNIDGEKLRQLLSG
jgi:threonine dehydratase